jgi:Ser/Thr protein kinase RdoA (MazF antagonist)
LNDQTIVPQSILDGLTVIAQGAPEHAAANIAVHADCHWGNWLVHDDSVTALLDFEWARFGEAADDWMFWLGSAGRTSTPCSR